MDFLELRLRGMSNMYVCGLWQAEELVKVGVREMAMLREPIPEVELQRAKNILLQGIYMNIEKQSDRLEELTRNVLYKKRQINCYGRIKLNEFQEEIRGVTVGAVQEQMNDMFKRPPTFVLKGHSSASKIWNEHKVMKLLQMRHR